MKIFIPTNTIFDSLTLILVTWWMHCLRTWQTSWQTLSVAMTVCTAVLQQKCSSTAFKLSCFFIFLLSVDTEKWYNCWPISGTKNCLLSNLLALLTFSGDKKRLVSSKLQFWLQILNYWGKLGCFLTFYHNFFEIAINF